MNFAFGLGLGRQELQGGEGGEGFAGTGLADQGKNFARVDGEIGTLHSLRTDIKRNS